MNWNYIHLLPNTRKSIRAKTVFKNQIKRFDNGWFTCLSILIKISSWPCALFTFSAMIIFTISLAIISREERVSFGVTSNVGNVLSLGTSVHCLQKDSLNKLAFSLKSVTKLLLTSNGGIRGIFLLL